MKPDKEFDEYLSGKKLYGDDFDDVAVKEWLRDEQEAYAELQSSSGVTGQYFYHALNRHHGFRHLPEGKRFRVLGLGSATGQEFIPIVDKIYRLTILEPSNGLRRAAVGGLPIEYIKPGSNSSLPFENGSFDLLTCFGVLHHIPKVTRTVAEFRRCLRPGGYVLIREPIISMGDWRYPRQGLTKRERGIPIRIFRDILARSGLDVMSEALCMFWPLQRILGLLGRAGYNSSPVTVLDHMLSRIAAWNTHYHRPGVISKLGPMCIFYVAIRPAVNGKR